MGVISCFPGAPFPRMWIVEGRHHLTAIRIRGLRSGALRTPLMYQYDPHGGCSKPRIYQGPRRGPARIGIGRIRSLSPFSLVMFRPDSSAF